MTINSRFNDSVRSVGNNNPFDKGRSNFALLITLVLLFLVPLLIAAQPTEQKIADQASSIKNAALQEADRIQTEKTLLSEANMNIEKYRKGDFTVSFIGTDGKPLRQLVVKVNQLTHEFLFGNLVFELTGFQPANPINTTLFKERFSALFNFAVFPFYWSNYEKVPGQPQWQKNTETIKWCAENGITMKGHTLGWTSPDGTPKWLLRLPETTAKEMYKARIINNVIGYKNSITVWDVVNEPVNTVSLNMALADTANNNDFRYKVKDLPVDSLVSWIHDSFRWANSANPEGHYILNEYFTLAIPAIRDRFYDLLSKLKNLNTPVSGVGIQAHEPREMWFSPIEMNKTFDLYGKLGYPIHITEFIPQSSGKKITGWRTGTWTEEAQAECARQFYTFAFAHPSIASITWWGLSDKNIWLKGGGLLDSAYNPKPVYNTLMKLIRQDWMTKNLSLKTGKNGEIAFKGFFGAYEILATDKNGVSKKFQVSMPKDGQRSCELKW